MAALGSKGAIVGRLVPGEPTSNIIATQPERNAKWKIGQPSSHWTASGPRRDAEVINLDSA